MAERTPIRVSTEAPTHVDLRLDDYEALDDFSADVEALAASGALVVDLRVTRPRVSIAEAATALRERAAQGTVVVHVKSERARRVVQDALRRGTAPPYVRGLGSIVVEVRLCSITDVDADAVVNASNTQPRLGGGVSGALRRAAGPELQDAMTALAPIESTAIVSTPAFAHTRARRILHVPTAGGTEDVVRAGFRNALEHAQVNDLGRRSSTRLRSRRSRASSARR